MKIIKFLSYAILIFLFSACGNGDLSRDEAADVIKKTYKYPNVEFTRIESENKYFNIMIPAGLVKTQGETNYYMGMFKTYHKTEIFDKLICNKEEAPRGAPAGVRNHFVTNSRIFLEVTGIQLNEDKKNATVTFSLLRKGITPLGKQLGYKENDTLKYSSKIQKFDDGWRLDTTNQSFYIQNVSEYSDAFDKEGNYILK